MGIIKISAFEGIISRIKTCFLEYCSCKDRNTINASTFLADTITYLIAFSISNGFIVEEEKTSNASKSTIPLTLAPVITYLIFKRYWNKILYKQLKSISINLFATTQNAPSNLTDAKNDLWLFNELKNIYARFYGKQCTNAIRKQWDAAFLVYSGYRKWYANPELLSQIKGQQEICFPSFLYYERINECLEANVVNHEYQTLRYHNDLQETFYPQNKNDIGWDAVSFFLNRLEANDKANNNSYLNQFIELLEMPDMDNKYEDFLKNALNDLLFDSDGNPIACEQFSKKYGLTEIFLKEPDEAASDYVRFSQRMARKPEKQCKIVLEYAIRFILKKRCCERLYNWLTSCIDLMFWERDLLAF